MSFNIQRSKRKTDYWKDNTPKEIAPGTYDPKLGGPVATSIGREASAPFNSVKERDAQERVNENPGPGSYTANYTVNETRVSSANPNNSFKTRVARFAPTAPGSTAYKTATSFFNPGPGSYFK